LEGTFKRHLVQSPCNEQGHLSLDQVAQSPIQPGLQTSNDGALLLWVTCSSVSPPHHPHGLKKISSFYQV